MKKYVDRLNNYTLTFKPKKYIDTHGIYQITNLMNGKFYIGSSISVGTRWGSHKSLLKNNKHPNQHLQNSWNKYGEEVFIFELIELVKDKSKLSEREQYWLDNSKACIEGYNISPSADNSFLSEETKQKIREKHTGKKASDETKLKMSTARKGENNAMYGRNHTEESKDKISKAKKGTCTGEDNHFYGKIHTEETKRKISKANTGRKMSEEWIEKCRERMGGENNPFYGKHHTEDSIAQIIETNSKRGTYDRASERMKLNNPNAGGKYNKKSVEMIDTKGNIIKKFTSLKEAGKYLNEKGVTQAKYCFNTIADACTGRSKNGMAHGYIWRYSNNEEDKST